MMDVRRALAQAKKVFGKGARVVRWPCHPYRMKDGTVRCTAFGVHDDTCTGGVPYCEIGVNAGADMGLSFFRIEASGGTFEEAFEKYEARRAKEKAEHEAARKKVEKPTGKRPAVKRPRRKKKES